MRPTEVAFPHGTSANGGKKRLTPTSYTVYALNRRSIDFRFKMGEPLFLLFLILGEKSVNYGTLRRGTVGDDMPSTDAFTATPTAS